MSLPELPLREEQAAVILLGEQRLPATVVFRSGQQVLVMPDTGDPPRRDPSAPVYRFSRSTGGWVSLDPRLPGAALQLGSRS